MNTPDKLPAWNPGSLMQTSGFYWKTCTLHAGVKLDVFSAIGQDEKTAQEIARQIDADDRAAAMLLNALSAMGLLVKNSGRYANTPESLMFLTRQSDRYIGFMIMHHHYLMESWSRLDQAVLTGRPTRSRSSFSDEKRRESFLMGMFNTAITTAPAVSKIVDLDGCATLLDLGGGPGTYAIHFAMQYPGLTAKVLDLPTTRPFAEKTIRRFNVSDRVEFIPGNFVEDTLDDMAGSFDAVWMSHILHGENPAQARDVVRKGAGALKSGGRIFIHEFILNSEMDGPLFPALFSLNMLAGTDGGQSYSEDQISDMMAGGGIENIQRLDFSGPTESGILSGTKK